MQQLQFPTYEFRFKNRENKLLIFDIIRKKFVVLTPEEWVRQHVVHHLVYDHNIPWSLINVEKQIKVNETTKRFDVVAFRSDGSIFLIVECKSPQINISQATFDQIARYNLAMQSQYLMVTNGLDHYFCRIDSEAGRYDFLKNLPPYNIK